MSDMLPLAMYALNVEPYTHTPAIGLDTPVTIRITMAAIDPEPFDDEKKPSTLRIIRRNPAYGYGDNHEHGDGCCDHDEEELAEQLSKDEEDQEDEDEDENEDEEDEEDDAEDDDDDEEEYDECVIATLSPETRCQAAVDITIAPEEDVQFLVTGSYTVSLIGNYVKHPFDEPFEEYDSHDDDSLDEEDYAEHSEDDEEDELDSQDESVDEEQENGSAESDEDEEFYDAISEGDEDIDEQLAKLEETSDVEGHLEQLIANDNKKKRKHDAEPESNESKKSKKEKKEALKPEANKPKAQVLEGGILIEDKKVGTGPHAKKGSKVGMRYIGKLKSGKVFDQNTSGKPFYFKLGRGEVIKGWDIGVAGMALGGERRIIIPAPYAYGKQALPGIPANSELTFDVKLVNLK
ncbi:Peptidyl-prolyl cis-trans isomerase [Nakaseomyces bracarensis]|uniref:FK506-binding protein n=1 Tax=Nakaseomyces bracarensis TaxID=273131 RepID=A0ABR4NSW8_9SACH